MRKSAYLLLFENSLVEKPEIEKSTITLQESKENTQEVEELTLLETCIWCYFIAWRALTIFLGFVPLFKIYISRS